MITNEKFHLGVSDDLVVWRIRGKSAIDYLFTRTGSTCFFVVSDNNRLTKFTVAAPEGPLTVINELLTAPNLEVRMLEVQTSPRISDTQTMSVWPEGINANLLVTITTPEAEAQLYEQSTPTLETLEF